MSPFVSLLRALGFSSCALGGLGLLSALSAAPARALVINASFDNNWTTSAPAGANTDVTNVINELQAAFNNPVTVNIQFDWGDINGQALPANALGVATFPSITAGYNLAQVNALFTTAAINNPTNAPLNTAVKYLPGAGSSYNNGTNFFIPTSEYKALTGTKSNALDAYVGFGTTGWDYSGGKPGAGSFDFTATLEHEITHALGRVDYAFASKVAGGAPPGNPPLLTPLNLYTYDCGTTTLDPNFNNTCFSINGGTTDLKSGTAGVFDNTSDSADWFNTITVSGKSTCGPGSDSFDSCANPGVFASMSNVDFTEMCALGWSGSACAVPEPPSLWLLLAGAIGLSAVSGRRRGRFAVRKLTRAAGRRPRWELDPPVVPRLAGAPGS